MAGGRNPSLPVVVIGAGWAGLATAVRLAGDGLPVTVVEATRSIGGRARSMRVGDTTLDNGQHILMGSYEEMLDIMELAGVRSKEVLMRTRFAFEVQGENGTHVRIDCPYLPAPANLLAGLIRARGLSTTARWRMMQLIGRIPRLQRTLWRDISVEALLLSTRQPPELIKHIWSPICTAALNTPPQIASARVFMRVLDQTLRRRRSDSDFLFPKTDLNRMFPQHATDFIESRGGRVCLNTRVERLESEGGRITGIETRRGALPASRVVIATGPGAAIRLLEPHRESFGVIQRLKQFDQNAIVTVYLRFDSNPPMGGHLLGLVGELSQWLIRRPSPDGHYWLAAVISGTGIHDDLDNRQMADAVKRDLRKLLPSWPEPVEHKVIREKQATLSCDVGIDQDRPENRTSLPGCWLAGDYTATGLPATLESAARSARECAAAVATDLNGDIG